MLDGESSDYAKVSDRGSSLPTSLLQRDPPTTCNYYDQFVFGLLSNLLGKQKPLCHSSRHAHTLRSTPVGVHIGAVAAVTLDKNTGLAQKVPCRATARAQIGPATIAGPQRGVPGDSSEGAESAWEDIPKI